jgi:hypothetical protein
MRRDTSSRSWERTPRSTAHACHTAAWPTQKLAKDCVGCHRSEDPHGGKLKADATLSRPASWRADIVFDHDLTDFPLLGLHRVVSCAQCHATLAFNSAPITCIGCHSHEDVHKGGLGKKCESCHSPNGWPLWVSITRSKRTFRCSARTANCNAPIAITGPGTVKLRRNAASCHHKDDRHLGEYGAQCDRCHTVDSWKGARIQ